MGGVSAGSGAGNGMTPTYRVYDHRLFFNCRRLRGRLRLASTPAGYLAITSYVTARATLDA